MATEKSGYPQTNKQADVKIRPLADFPPCIWTDRFKPITIDKQVYDMHAKEIEMLKEEVRGMLIKSMKDGTTIHKLNLVDTVEQLGISYHFDKEIDSILHQIFLQNGPSKVVDDDLYATALQFRLLRQHGFNVSSSVFQQFLNSNGEFKETLTKDKRGLLSLYQAAYLRTQDDTILEEALSFATTHLKCGEELETMPSSLAKQIKHALEQSLHRGVPRVEARHFISVYEEDEAKNTTLLRLAKLDFYYLQILHRKELDQIESWIEELKLVSEVPYSRARWVECYFWGLATFFEPQYSLCRILSAKSSVFITTIDDTYDAYGDLDELKAFRDAIERWDIKEADGLPEYMRKTYIALINVVEWMDQEFAKQGMSRSYVSSKYKEEWKRYVRASYTQSKWFLNRELPAFQDYKEAAIITSAYFILAPASLAFMKMGIEEVFDWLAKDPKIVVAASKIGRFINDIASYESEKQRGTTGLECYMNSFNVSEEEAIKKFEEIVEDAWKEINEELLMPATDTMPREILMVFLNLARILDVTYKHNLDGYTDPALVLEPHIVDVLLDLIVL
ncbi:OLC1v1019128C1 [Oldenlandia corymbosa var. corymbosa]|uniref:myrcene synthase n=1 Tax=Oldenlandia corymbosa var. corymbosa TaxID=529605 RepID=A0AAV1EDB3_OLDCO|nr:OLC1v1019128C1 [Oldenlandia corymbosa var. corymbosa]